MPYNANLRCTRFHIVGSCSQQTIRWRHSRPRTSIHGGQPELESTYIRGWRSRWFRHEADAYRSTSKQSPVPGKSAGARWTSDPDGPPARARIDLVDWTQLLMEKKGRPCVVHPSLLVTRERSPSCSFPVAVARNIFRAPIIGMQCINVWFHSSACSYPCHAP